MREKIVPVLAAFFLLASLASTAYELGNRDRLQPNRAFELVHNFPTDFNFYLSRIRQGIEGRFTVIEQYTSEPHKGSFIHVFYLWLGWLGRWTRVPWHRAADVYHVARVVFGGLLLVMIAEFCKKAFEQRIPSSSGLTRGSRSKDTHSILAFLLAVTASTWPKLVFFNGGWRFGGFMPWWSVMDSLQRITFIPHLLAGQALIAFLVMALSDADTMRKSGNGIFLGVLAFLLGIIFPPGLLFVIATVAVLTLLDRQEPVARAAVLLLGAPALGYLWLMTSFYPWRRLAEFDVVRPLPFDYGEYLLAVGPILPIGVVGLAVALVCRQKRLFPAVAWVIAWALLLVAFRFIPQQSPLRFSEMIPHVPLAVLASHLFSHVSARYRRYARHIVFLPASLIVIGLGVMYSSFLWQKDFIDHKMRAALPLVPTGSYVMYPLKDFIAAIRYLQDATGSREAVILSETTAGNYIPVYAGNTVYVGHANTVRAEEKEATVKAFFSGRMKPDDARAFLERENLHWIFYGPQEKEDGGIGNLAKRYPFLHETYRNGFVTIYAWP